MSMAIFSLSERLGQFFALSDKAEQHLEGANWFQKSLEARANVIRAGEAIAYVPVVESGWIASHDVTPDGQRGILEIALPGDVLSGPMHASQPVPYTMRAVTACTVTFYPTPPIIEVMRRNSDVAAAFLHLETYQHERLQDRLLPLLQLRSYERITHFFLDLQARLDAVGLVTNGRFRMPLNQASIADHLGMHEVHVNRVLRRMDQEGYVRREKGYITILDHATLAEMVGFRDRPLPPRHAHWGQRT